MPYAPFSNPYYQCVLKKQKKKEEVHDSDLHSLSTPPPGGPALLIPTNGLIPRTPTSTPPLWLLQHLLLLPSRLLQPSPNPGFHKRKHEQAHSRDNKNKHNRHILRRVSLKTSSANILLLGALTERQIIAQAELAVAVGARRRARLRPRDGQIYDGRVVETGAFAVEACLAP